MAFGIIKHDLQNKVKSLSLHIFKLFWKWI